eukprot:scaffold1951_cov258-Pinguiococcus_pyrenoidosus.AAC.18
MSLRLAWVERGLAKLRRAPRKACYEIAMARVSQTCVNPLSDCEDCDENDALARATCHFCAPCQWTARRRRDTAPTWAARTQSRPSCRRLAWAGPFSTSARFLWCALARARSYAEPTSLPIFN